MQQLLAIAISKASQIQMENRSHSVLLIMYGADRATGLWATGGLSHALVRSAGRSLKGLPMCPGDLQSTFI